jgi:adenylate kinase family enzyme
MRVVVVGTSGAGKSTAARRIGQRLGLEVIELDSLFHLPGWSQRPEEEFRSLVAEATAGESWVVDGNYAVVRDVIWPRADVVIWLDYARWRVMARVIRRTLKRLVTRELLWGKVTEPWSNVLSLDPEKSIIAWAWSTYGDRRRYYGVLAADPAFAHIEFHHLSHPGDLGRVFERLEYEDLPNEPT